MGDGLLHTDTGERADLHLGLLGGIFRLAAADVGADDAEHERQRDGDDARVGEREVVEVGVGGTSTTAYRTRPGENAISRRQLTKPP